MPRQPPSGKFLDTWSQKSPNSSRKAFKEQTKPFMLPQATSELPQGSPQYKDTPSRETLHPHLDFLDLDTYTSNIPTTTISEFQPQSRFTWVVRQPLVAKLPFQTFHPKSVQRLIVFLPRYTPRPTPRICMADVSPPFWITKLDISRNQNSRPSIATYFISKTRNHETPSNPRPYNSFSIHLNPYQRSTHQHNIQAFHPSIYLPLTVSSNPPYFSTF